MQPEPARLLIHRFAPGTRLEGGVLGALERMDLPGKPRLLDALFVARDAESADLEAVDLATGRASGSVVAMLDFRLDPGRRRAVTQRTLAGHPGGVPSAVVQAIGAALEPGGAILAVLVAGGQPTDLADAVHRAGGRLLVDERVDAVTLAALGPRLLAAP
jgi:hypothetical protein